MRLSLNTAFKGLMLICILTSWSGANSQSAEMVSTYVFDKEKVLLVDGDRMVVVPEEYEAGTLALRMLGSGNVIASFGTGRSTYQEVNGRHYILSNQTNPSIFKLFQYLNGSLELLYSEAIVANPFREIVPSNEGVMEGWAAMRIEEGVLFIGPDTLIERDVHPGWFFQGSTSWNGRLFALFDKGWAEFNPSTFEVIGEHDFLAPWIPVRGALFGPNILLTDGTWNASPDYRIYNILTNTYSELTDTSGNLVTLPSILGTSLFVEGSDACFAVEAPFNFLPNFYSPKQGLARVDLESGIARMFAATNTKREARTVIPFHPSAHGFIAFAKLEASGTEPYLFGQDGFELIKDIHRGGARSVEIPLMQGFVNINPNLGLEAFDAISVEGIVYFAANEPGTGREIWCSDGSAAGTKLCTELFEGEQGVGPAYFSKDLEGRVYVVSGATQNDMRLYRLPEPGAEPDLPEGQLNKWIRSFGMSDDIIVTGGFTRSQSGDLHPAADGSVAALYSGFDADHDWIAYDDTAHVPAVFVQGSNAVRSVAQIVNSDGSLRNMVNIQGGSNDVYMARHYQSGEMIFAVRYRNGPTYFNEQAFNFQGEGIHLFGTDDAGNLMWNRSLPGTNIAFRTLTYGDEGFYAFGWFKGSLQFGSGNAPLSAPDGLPCLFAFDDDGAARWAAPFDQPNDNFGAHSGALYTLTYDGVSSRVYAATGGTGYNTTGTCAHSKWDVHAAAFDGSSGQRIWNKTLVSSDQIRATSIAVLPDGRMWLSGHTRGDIELGDLRLTKTENFMPCSWNGFHAVFNGTNGKPINLAGDQPELAKIIFDTKVRDGLIYMTSLVMDGTNIPHPITGRDAGVWIQLDAMAPNGTVLDSRSWELSKWYHRWFINDLLVDHKPGLAFHPDGGSFISILNMTQGTVGGEYPMASQQHNMSSISIMHTGALHPDFGLIEADLPQVDALLVYPNPTSTGDFSFQVKSADLGVFEKVSMYDAQGKLIHAVALNPLLVNAFVSLPAYIRSGLYTLIFEGKGRSESVKLMLNN